MIKKKMVTVFCIFILIFFPVLLSAQDQTTKLLGEALRGIGEVSEQNRNHSNRLDKIETELQNIEHSWGVKKTVTGYGDGKHIWTNKQAMCPEGQYVVGIKVRYRGSCLNKCDQDGGIIGDISLICRSIK